MYEHESGIIKLTQSRSWPKKQELLVKIPFLLFGSNESVCSFIGIKQWLVAL